MNLTFRLQPALKRLIEITFLRNKTMSYSTQFSTTHGDQKPQVVFVLGGPGAGKGTQCKNIVEKYGYVHLSAGDLLRKERICPSSQYGQLIESYITDGKIVPSEITCSLIVTAMTQSMKKKFLIDGFPRNQDNLDEWTKTMGNRVTLLFVLFFECHQSFCVDRCLKRGKAGSGRTDDNPDSLKKRFDTYMNDTMPIIRHYEAQNLVKRVDSNRWPEPVFKDVEDIFDSLAND